MNIIGKRLSKIYGSGEGRVIALDKADLNISSGDFVSIIDLLEAERVHYCIYFLV